MRLHFSLYSKAFPLQPLLWLGIAISILAGCSKLGVDNPVEPTVPLPKFELLTDSAGTATLNLDSLAGGRAFTITFGTFRHGRIELAAGSSRLRYTATDTSRGWVADSGLYTFCQASQCRDGQIKVRNLRFRRDTIIVGPEPDTCVALPLRRLYIDEAETQRISLGFTAGDTCTLVVNNVAYTLRQVGDRSSTSFDYIASGGPQNYYSGFDEITYRGTVQGRRVCGTVEVVVGDSCQPRARPDIIPRAQSGAITILPTQLLNNDLGCTGVRASFRLRLRPTVYLGFLQITTRLGTITDTTIAGSQAFVYRRTAATSAGADVFRYYTQDRNTDLVTRATVTLP
jgi:hypothetical protein